MKNIKKYLCAIVMMVISMTAFAQEDVFTRTIYCSSLSTLWCKMS